MTKVATIVRDTLLVLRVIDAQSAPEAEDSRDAISMLNRMMANWEADGVALGWAPVTSVNDDLPAPPEAEEAIIYNLALRLRGPFRKTMPIEDITLAASSFGSLLGRNWSTQHARLDYELPAPEATRGGSWRDGLNC